jgi:hypothetical protein
MGFSSFRQAIHVCECAKFLLSSYLWLVFRRAVAIAAEAAPVEKHRGILSLGTCNPKMFAVGADIKKPLF